MIHLDHKAKAQRTWSVHTHSFTTGRIVYYSPTMLHVVAGRRKVRKHCPRENQRKYINNHFVPFWFFLITIISFPSGSFLLLLLLLLLFRAAPAHWNHPPCSVSNGRIHRCYCSPWRTIDRARHQSSDNNSGQFLRLSLQAKTIHDKGKRTAKCQLLCGIV
jgi:hypothetical protein